MLNPGDILNGRYKIIAKIGQGGFGQTYTAKDLDSSTHILCVVKEIITPSSQNPHMMIEIEERFKREGKTLALLGQHPQIPYLFDHFRQEDKFYLVQEYIDGEDLSEVIGTGKLPLNESEVILILKDVLEVLKVVHQHNIIHRDLKPSNLRRRFQDGKIILLDFGAVKELNSLNFDSEETSITITKAIGTPGYMSPEQQSGNPQLNSDLYALGMICIQALIGVHPRTLPSEPLTGNMIWRYSTSERNMVEVSPALEKILDKMVCYHFRERYPSAQEALDDLIPLINKSSPKLIPPLKRKTISQKLGQKLTVTTGLGIATLIFIFAWINYEKGKTCPKKMLDDISCGEEILTRGVSSPEKKEGVKAFAQGKYQEAVAWLEKARQKLPEDPETLVYLNNAQLAVTKTPFYTIAVAVPLGNPSDGGDAGKEILRGVAQLQRQVNQNKTLNGFGLRVVVADDYNNPDRSQQIAEILVAQPEILAVVGHYSSDNTRAALPIYEDHRLAVISATSTAQTLAEDFSVFFRTVPRDRVLAIALAEYLYQDKKQNKVAIFYNPNSAYSRSLYEQFLLSFDNYGGLVVKQFDLSQPIFNPDAAINQAVSRGATTLVLFPDAKVNPYAFLNGLKIIRGNKNRYQIVGGDSLYTTDIIQERSLSDNLIVAISWYYLSGKNQEFTKSVQQLWGTDPSWRTAMSYDASKVLAMALKEQVSLTKIERLQATFNSKIRRLKLLESLEHPNFKTQGITGDVSFEPSGDRSQKVVELVKVAPSRCSPYGYMFIPVADDTAKMKQCPTN
jgi:ABC-type branched-subunit amino acid transport system substrate-binding protein/serine/threonine protein kinase